MTALTATLSFPQRHPRLFLLGAAVLWWLVYRQLVPVS